MTVEGHVFPGRDQACARAGCTVTQAEVWLDIDCARDSHHQGSRCVGFPL